MPLMNQEDQRQLQRYLRQYYDHLIERKRYMQASEVLSVLMELRTNKFNREPNFDVKFEKK